MNNRKIHKIAGMILLLPMIGWAITGIVFFIKPGYQQAYEQLAINTYPLSQDVMLSSQHHWQEVRLINSILGAHLLVKTKGKTQHLNAHTLQAMPLPPPAKIQQLIQDAIAHNPSRYGNITALADTTATTSTGINITLDWPTLKLRQVGQDTKLINALYKIHYLQWTPNKTINQVLGISGLLLLILLTIFGLRLYLSHKAK